MEEVRTLDQISIELAGDTVYLLRGIEVIRKLSYSEFVEHIARRHTGINSECPIPFDDAPTPNGHRWTMRQSNYTLVVVEQDPTWRHVKWIADESKDPFGPGASYKTVRLAFPFIVLFVLFDHHGDLAGYHQAYYRTEKIRSIHDSLFYTNLRNCTAWHGMKSALCITHDRCDYNLRRLSWSEKINRFVEIFWTTWFNKSSEAHGEIPYYTLMKDVDPRISTLSRWEEESAKDPLFPLNVRWKPAKTTIYQQMKEMLALIPRPPGQAGDLGELFDELAALSSST